MFLIFLQGCKEKLVSWLRNTADILFVIGYCIISFLKITFLGILRYEIKEMIQKIKLLQAEMATAILEGNCGIIGSTDQTQVCINVNQVHVKTTSFTTFLYNSVRKYSHLLIHFQ